MDPNGIWSIGFQGGFGQGIGGTQMGGAFSDRRRRWKETEPEVETPKGNEPEKAPKSRKPETERRPPPSEYSPEI